MTFKWNDGQPRYMVDSDWNLCSVTLLNRHHSWCGYVCMHHSTNLLKAAMARRLLCYRTTFYQCWHEHLSDSFHVMLLTVLIKAQALRGTNTHTARLQKGMVQSSKSRAEQKMSVFDSQDFQHFKVWKPWRILSSIESVTRCWEGDVFVYAEVKLHHCLVFQNIFVCSSINTFAFMSLLGMLFHLHTHTLISAVDEGMRCSLQPYGIARVLKSENFAILLREYCH